MGSARRDWPAEAPMLYSRLAAALWGFRNKPWEVIRASLGTNQDQPEANRGEAQT